VATTAVNSYAVSMDHHVVVRVTVAYGYVYSSCHGNPLEFQTISRAVVLCVDAFC